MKNALENSVPTQLYDAYETVMDAIFQSNNDSKELAQKILSWIFHAKRPLRMNELRIAIAVRDGDVELDEEDLMPSDEIVEVCASLLNHDTGSGIVGFSHPMVQEFLKSRYMHFIVNELVIAKTCLTYLRFDVFDGPCEDENSYAERIEKHPFARYAAQYWATYVKSADGEADTKFQPMLIQLVDSQGKADAMQQLCVAGKASDWNSQSVHHEYTLLHILAYYDLRAFARTILNRDLLNVILSCFKC